MVRNEKKIPENTKIEAGILEWGKENLEQIETIIKEKGPFDIIVGCELIYDDILTKKLFETLDILAKWKEDLILILAYAMHKPNLE